MPQSLFPLIAVDIGNTRVKLGLFSQPGAAGALPAPERSLTLDADWQGAHVDAWLPRAAAEPLWLIASVNRASEARLLEYLKARSAPIRLLAAADLPLEVPLENPDYVGIDRLVDAVAVNVLRERERPAIVVDIGSAITVDVVSASGAFLGGAILPGIGMSAKALHQFTSLLPLISVSDLADPPAPLGNATLPAMRSGLFWGAVGAIRELIARLSGADAPNPRVFITGGAGPAVAGLLSSDRVKVEYVPHMTLGGIAMSAEKAASR